MKLFGTLMAALGVAMFGGVGSFADDDGRDPKPRHHQKHHRKEQRHHRHHHHCHKDKDKAKDDTK